MEIREICAVVRNSVPTMDVARALGLNVDRHGRCSCPFHHGQDRNMKVYDGTRGYYCFVCHKGGDCISLVTGVAPELSYTEAMWWINDRFNLGLRQEHEKPSIFQRERNAKMRQREARHGIQDSG